MIGSSGLLDNATQQINVVAAPAKQLAFVTGPFTTQAGAFSGVLSVQRRDQFGNPNSSDAALVVTLATTSTAPSADFVAPTSSTPLPSNQMTIANGSNSASFRYVDTLRGIPLITAVGSGVSGTAQRQTIIGTTAARLVVLGSSTQQAGTSQNLTLRAFDTYNNISDVYTGTKSLTFSGAGSALGGQAPSVSDNGGAARSFSVATGITFNTGVATVNGAANGVMTLYRAETAVIGVTDGAISAAPADRLTVTVTAAPRTLVARRNASQRQRDRSPQPDDYVGPDLAPLCDWPRPVPQCLRVAGSRELADYTDRGRLGDRYRAGDGRHVDGLYGATGGYGHHRADFWRAWLHTLRFADREGRYAGDGQCGDRSQWHWRRGAGADDYRGY